MTAKQGKGYVEITKFIRQLNLDGTVIAEKSVSVRCDTVNNARKLFTEMWNHE